MILIIVIATFIGCLLCSRQRMKGCNLPKVTRPVLVAKRTGVFARDALHSAQLLYWAQAARAILDKAQVSRLLGCRQELWVTDGGSPQKWELSLCGVILH